MENQDNKILADKLNSLQELPVGYTPDLSSKWEIVEASLPEKNKRRKLPIWVRWSVAASVLIGVCTIGLNKQIKNEYGKNVVRNTVPKYQPKSIAVNPTQQAEWTVVSAQKDTNKALTVSRSTVTVSTSDITVDQQRKLIDKETSTIDLVHLNKDLPVVDNNTAIQIKDSSTQEELVVASVTEKIKPAKKKIYQRDFNDGVLAMDTGFTNTNSQHFSIKLLPFNRKVNSGDDQPVRRLQLKTNL